MYVCALVSHVHCRCKEFLADHGNIVAYAVCSVCICQECWCFVAEHLMNPAEFWCLSYHRERLFCIKWESISTLEWTSFACRASKIQTHISLTLTLKNVNESVKCKRYFAAVSADHSTCRALVSVYFQTNGLEESFCHVWLMLAHTRPFVGHYQGRF